MRLMCVGALLCGLACVFAATGCDRIGTSSQQDGDPAGDGQAGDGQAGDGQAGDGADDSRAADDSPATSRAANATASPDKRGHLAPQQVATGGDGRARNITFDNIKFEMDDPKSRLFERSMLTEAIEKLSGNRVRIRGFILPSAYDELPHFILVRDNQQCCFGPGAAIYDSIMVDMTEGESTTFTTRPVTVEGTFAIEEIIGPDDRHMSIYHLTATKVE
ncbi:MAG: DUF3299 domain-containing protein [Pirellulales bacterium]